MAMDIRISRNYNVEMGALFPRQLLAVFHISLVLVQGMASPVWMPQFLSGGQGRSIRHLPCVSRRSGEQGICMFAYTCLKSNGTHLGTCIDRFYFGSCCKLADPDDLLAEDHFPVINSNAVTSPYYPSTANTLQTFSVQSEVQKITENLFPTKLAYPTRTTQKVETSTMPAVFGSTGFDKYDTTDRTVVDLAQHLATETYFLTPSTEKLFVPVHTSKPNKTEVVSSGSNLFSTMISSSGSYGDTKRPTPAPQSAHGATRPATTTTQPFLLSTFQVVHNQGDASTSSSVKATAAPPATASNSKFPQTSGQLATVGPSTPELISTWTPVKQDFTTPTSIRKNSTDPGKPSHETTTKKPAKPTKPYTTTRKPTTKKPTVKPAAKPTSAAAPVKVTTSKPTAPVKKPTQPTKKPSTGKPSPAKPSQRPNVTSSSGQAVKATTPSPGTTTARTKVPTRPTATTVAATPRPPAFSTYVDTTSEVIFTKPGLTPAPGYGITTFRPDLGGTSSKPALITGSGLTTFSYVSGGVKDTTPRPMETTTSRFKPSRPTGENFPTVSNEIPTPHWPGAPGISQAQQENTNIPAVLQQVASTLRPSSSTSVTSARPADTSVPFFPDAQKPGMPTQWIEMVQTSTRPESPYPPPMTTSTTTTTTMNQAATVMAIFEGLNQSDYTQVCGRRIYPQARVVGGEKSSFGKWPWQISLRQWRTSTYLHKCGAALLNENWAITAAHCVENVPPSDLLLRLGEHDLSTEDEPFGFQERRVQIVASHPQFDPRTFEYDLALLRFYEPVKFQPNIIPVCVPEDNTNFVGQTAYVTGWGRLYEDGPLPSVLQEVSVPVINNTLCENMYRSAGYIEHIPEIFICAGWKKGGFDSCEGDSGGPMVIQRPDKRWLLAGVISWGIGCAEPNQPGVYTRISEFREWIHQILQF